MCGNGFHMRQVLVVCGMAVILAGYPARPAVAQDVQTHLADFAALADLVETTYRPLYLEALAKTSYKGDPQGKTMFGAFMDMIAARGEACHPDWNEQLFYGLVALTMSEFAAGTYADLEEDEARKTDPLRMLRRLMGALGATCTNEINAPHARVLMPLRPYLASLPPLPPIPREGLARIAASEEELRKAEADRQAAEADRQTAEARAKETMALADEAAARAKASAETARQIRTLLGVPEP